MVDFSMTVETKNFNRHINEFSKKSNLSLEIILKKFAFDLLARIIRKSPVDTGRSRAGWFVAMEKLGKGSVDIQRKSRSGANSYSIGAEKEGRALGKFIDHTKNTFDKWILIVNGVNYVIYLEYGSSRQAPYGMVRVSMRELRRGILPKEMGTQLRKDWNSFYI